jgi:hypothetical protein
MSNAASPLPRIRTARRAFVARATLFAAVLVALLAAVCSTAAATTPNRPDLVPMLPTVDPQNNVPFYVDPYSWEAPTGHVLYRFDAVIMNEGGALDLFRDPVTGDAMQAIYRGGSPAVQPDPNQPPSDPNLLKVEDRTVIAGASYVYPGIPGHMHWHFNGAAMYELLVPGEAPRVSAKVGFCMNDSWGLPVWFNYGYTGSGPGTWCMPYDPTATFVRMGVSAGVGDLYWSTVPSQWVDVTGLRPGNYRLLAKVNPYGYIDELHQGNDSLTVTRMIPGTIATAKSITVSADTPHVVHLAGKIVGPDVPARSSPDCYPDRVDMSCLVSASSTGPLSFAITTQPAHGTVTIDSQSGLAASATYTPTTGYSGADSFSFTVTDVRDLTSQPAEVTIAVASGAAGRG